MLMLKNNNGWTPLMIAAHKGHLGVVEELLIAGASVNQTHVNVCTALMTDRNNCLKIKKILEQFLEVKNWISINKEVLVKKISDTLHEANSADLSKEQKIIKLLLENFQDKIEKNNELNPKIVTFLKKEFINSLIFENEKYSLLHMAVFNDMGELVNHLVHEWSIDINYKDTVELSAWQHACFFYKKKMLWPLKNMIN